MPHKIRMQSELELAMARFGQIGVLYLRIPSPVCHTVRLLTPDVLSAVVQRQHLRMEIVEPFSNFLNIRLHVAHLLRILTVNSWVHHIFGHNR